MGKDRTENFESPLDEVFEELPQENPPANLQQRCLAALDEIDAERGSLSVPRWYAPLRNVVATAAVLVLAVGLFTLLPLFMSAKKAARSTSCLSNQGQLRVAAQPPSQPVPKVEAGPRMAPGMPGAPPTPPAEDVDELRSITARIAPSPPPGREPTVNTEPLSGKLRFQGEREMFVSEEAEAEEEWVEGGDAFGFDDGHAKWAGRPADSTIVTHAARQQPALAPQPPQAPEVEEPWRDLSGEREVVVDKELELEVKDVEKSYDEARLIVEKHGGFVASDEISIDAHALDTAVLTIRLPKDGFEAAITELRELGRVIKLVGESQDVTREYFTQGAGIRSRADREQMLVEKYEKETNSRKKRQLKAEIEQLRREMRREKEILTKLAEETHWPTLQLTLRERGGPVGFLSEMLERSGGALAWVGATAIIWVPLVVLLTLFWGRLRRTSQ